MIQTHDTSDSYAESVLNRKLSFSLKWGIGCVAFCCLLLLGLASYVELPVKTRLQVFFSGTDPEAIIINRNDSLLVSSGQRVKRGQALLLTANEGTQTSSYDGQAIIVYPKEQTQYVQPILYLLPERPCLIARAKANYDLIAELRKDQAVSIQLSQAGVPSQLQGRLVSITRSHDQEAMLTFEVPEYTNVNDAQKLLQFSSIPGEIEIISGHTSLLKKLFNNNSIYSSTQLVK